MIYIVATAMSILIVQFYKSGRSVALKSSTFNSEYSLPSIVMLISMMPLFLIAAMRYFVGIDYTTYTNYQIPMILNGYYQVRVEILYRYLIIIGNYLGQGNTYQYIFALTAFLICFFVYKAIQEQSVNASLSIYLFVMCTFYNYSLSGMRQSIAIAIFLYALKYIKSEEIWKYFFWIVIAIGFHNSATIFLPLYFVRKIKVPWQFVLAAFPVLFFISGYIRQLLILIMNAFGLYSGYFGGRFDNGDLNLPQGLFIVFITMIVIFVCVFYGSEVDKESDLRIEINIQYLLFLILSFARQLPTASRTLYLFIPICILLMPNIVKAIDNRNIRTIVYLVLFSGTGVYYLYALFSQNIYNTLPYHFIPGL